MPSNDTRRIRKLKLMTLKLKYFIDSHKAITWLVVLGMIAWHDQWRNPTALIYLAMHGSYGILWALKSRIFPDTSWERPVSVGYGVLAAWGALSLYGSRRGSSPRKAFRPRPSGCACV